MFNNKTTIVSKQSYWILYWKKNYAWSYALSLVCSFDKEKKKHNSYRGRDCIKRFCSDLKELGIKIINYKQKEMIPLTDKEISSMKSKKNVAYAKKSFVMIQMKKKN